ncbi:DUF1538 domain-containing protein [Elusimicrobiota bacterium]
MSQKIRFGEFVREISLQQKQISYNDVVPKPKKDPKGRYIPYQPPRVRLKSIDIYRLLAPYTSIRFLAQVKTVVPLALYLMLFQLLILRQHVSDAWIITAGFFAVIVGLMLFMEGLKLGLMPFGEAIGNILPAKCTLPTVLFIALLLGIGVTFAEPAIGALKTAGSIIDVTKAPYLYALLNQWSGSLVLIVGTGVGLAAILGTLRFLYSWSLKPLIYLCMIPVIGLTAYLMFHNELSNVLGLAWDCGAVTTGPVTVPLVLALGIGIAAAAGKGGDNPLSGFGIVTLASLFPVIGVMLLAIYVSMNTSPQAIIEAAQMSSSAVAQTTPWYARTPGEEIILGIRAILPLAGFLFIVIKGVMREPIRHGGIIAYGITLCVAGMIIFNLGLTYGLVKLGGQAGAFVPAAFTSMQAVAASPLYTFTFGIFVAVMFAWLLGLGATLAEPALNALGLTVETLTNGAFKKSMLMYAVSLGVGCGIALGVLKIIFNIPLGYLIIPGYSFAVILTFLSNEEFVNIAWDSAGVTTGPVTVPLVLAMGLGLGNAVNAIEGFGILSMASIGPIIFVMGTGLWVQWKIKRRRSVQDRGIRSA